MTQATRLRYRVGAVLVAILAVLTMAGTVSAQTIHRAPATVKTHTVTALMPTAQGSTETVTISDVGGTLTKVALPMMVCGNGWCGSTEYQWSNGNITVSYAGHTYHASDWPWYKKAAMGCMIGVEGYGIWLLMSSWDTVMDLGAVSAICVTGAIAAIIIP